MTPPTGSAARTDRAGNAPYLGGALSMNDFAEQLNTQSEMLDGLKNTMVQTMSELRELMDNAPHEVLSEMARRMRDQLQQGGMLEIEDRLIRLLERKDAGSLAGVFGGDVWSRIREEMEEIEAKRNDEDRKADFRQDGRQAEQQRAEEIRAERERLVLIEAENDNTPSSEHPGMTVGEVLRGLRIINENLSFYSQRAVDKGLIKPEERIAFEEYMRREYWLKQQEALGKTNTPEYIAAKRAQDEANRNNPTFRPAAIQMTAGAGTGFEADIGQTRTTATPLSAEQQARATGNLANGDTSTIARLNRGLVADTPTIPSVSNPIATAETRGSIVAESCSDSFCRANNATRPLDNPYYVDISQQNSTPALTQVASTANSSPLEIKGTTVGISI